MTVSWHVPLSEEEADRLGRWTVWVAVVLAVAALLLLVVALVVGVVLTGTGG